MMIERNNASLPVVSPAVGDDAPATPAARGFLYWTGAERPSSQHSISRVDGISPAGQEKLRQHLGSGKFAKRESRHSVKHYQYVRAALENNRPLTLQEADARAGGRKGAARDGNIAHVIPNSMVQRQLNRAIVAFQEGREQLGAHIAAFLSAAAGPEPASSSDERRQALAGLARQAAAAGAMWGLGDAMLREEQAHEGYGRLIAHPTAPRKHAMMAGDLATVFGDGRASTPQERQEAYGRFMRNTADSYGNTRIGNKEINSAIGSGVDLELTRDMKPTERSKRLYQAVDTFAPQNEIANNTFATDGMTYNLGYFATHNGQPLSSSMEA